MKVNGFNSDDYLYFRITSNIPYNVIAFDSFQEGDIVKIPLQFLERYVFNGNYEIITSHSLSHEIKSYPAGEPFDLLKYIKMQDPLIFDRYGSLSLYFYGPYVLINGNGDGSVFHTGITYLDEIICGLHKQELTIIGARPGVGKTTKVIVEIEEEL